MATSRVGPVFTDMASRAAAVPAATATDQGQLDRIALARVHMRNCRANQGCRSGDPSGVLQEFASGCGILRLLGHECFLLRTVVLLPNRVEVSTVSLTELLADSTFQCTVSLPIMASRWGFGPQGLLSRPARSPGASAQIDEAMQKV